MEARLLTRVLPRRVSMTFGLIGRALGLLATTLLIGCLASIVADPGAASFALGGLQFRKEPRISMLRERLTIVDGTEESGAPDVTITADYDFLNNTNHDVTIPMAFPVPDHFCRAAASPYMVFVEEGNGEVRIPFHVWVEGQEIKYSTEARAFRSDKYSSPSSEFPSDLGKDYTGLLRKLGVDPESCFVDEGLSQSAKLNLVALGLLESKTYDARWTVRRKYYWTQTFLANKTTRIRIEYPPLVGYSDIYLGNGWSTNVLQSTASLWREELRGTCGGPNLQRKLVAEVQRPDGIVNLSWLDFILVTANYWNGPIKDFVLTVETADRVDGPGTHVSFCWDGPIKRPDATHIVATAHDFSPKRNLHIGFFQVD